MNTQLIGSQAVKLLSQLTGQELTISDVTPQVIFTTDLIVLLMGVIHADQKVAEDEIAHLKDTLNKLNLTHKDTLELVKLLLSGIKKNKLYSQIDNFLVLLVPLTESEKLLLFGLGYRMAMADSHIEENERKYLQNLGNRLEIEPRYLNVLEYVFSGQQYIAEDLEEVCSLIDPARFRDIGTIFVDAANSLIEALPQVAKTEESSVATAEFVSGEYQKLQKFQLQKQSLIKRLSQLSQLIESAIQESLLPITFREDIQGIQQSLTSQRFRVAVIGEFSQGKSTLLNALLGEEIQPVRAIPCSGTISVLKYGKNKRVICRYRDQREEEIEITQYKEKTAISKQAALQNRAEEILKSNIEEIIFEHPNLSLCVNGVEIVDSPSLNEHPERTAITQKLLQGTDAIIFMTNANQALTQGEIAMIKSFQQQVDIEKQKPLENLFLAVNFIDCIDDENDLQDIKTLVKNIAQDTLIVGKDRIHFISAKAAFRATLEGKQNEYLTVFKEFTQALENFLTDERGSIVIQNLNQKLNELIQACIQELDSASKNINVPLSQSSKQQILEQIGEASGRFVIIRKMAEFLREQSFQLAWVSWDEYTQGLKAKVIAKSEEWKTAHNPIFSRDALIQDFIEQFDSALQTEINQWSVSELKDSILASKLSLLDRGIKAELDALNASFSNLDAQIGTNFSESFRPILKDFDVSYVAGFAATGVGVGGGTAAAMFFLIPALTLGPAVIAGIIAALVLGGGLGALSAFDAYKQIAKQVCKSGFAEFEKSEEKTKQKIKESIDDVFITRAEAVGKLIKQAISDCENRLEQEEKKHQQNTERLKDDILTKKQEFEKLLF